MTIYSRTTSKPQAYPPTVPKQKRRDFPTPVVRQKILKKPNPVRPGYCNQISRHHSPQGSYRTKPKQKSDHTPAHQAYSFCLIIFFRNKDTHTLIYKLKSRKLKAKTLGKSFYDEKYIEKARTNIVSQSTRPTVDVVSLPATINWRKW